MNNFNKKSKKKIKKLKIKWKVKVKINTNLLELIESSLMHNFYSILFWYHWYTDYIHV